MRLRIIGIIILLIGSITVNANAVVVDGYFSAPYSNMWVWGWDGAGAFDDTNGWYSLGTSYTSPVYIWGNNPPAGQTVDIFFAVMNTTDIGDGYDAAFLGEIFTDTGWFDATYPASNRLPSPLAYYGMIGYFDGEWGGGVPDPTTFDSSAWEQPFLLGANDGSVFDQIPEIGEDAEWMWRNYVEADASETPYRMALIKTSFTLNESSVVPEPASVALVLSGLVGLLGMKRKAYKR